MADSADSPPDHTSGALSRLLAAPLGDTAVGLEALLSAFLDTATDGVIVIGVDGRVLTYNDRIIEVCGVSRHILMTRDEGQVWAALAGNLRDEPISSATLRPWPGTGVGSKARCSTCSMAVSSRTRRVS